MSVTFGYMFLLAFVFLVVMVLMNLLNGLAVSDIAEIVNASEIEGNISTIHTISYFESVLLGDPLRNDSLGNNDSSLCQGLQRMSLLQVQLLECNSSNCSFNLSIHLSLFISSYLFQISGVVCFMPLYSSNLSKDNRLDRNAIVLFIFD